MARGGPRLAEVTRKSQAVAEKKRKEETCAAAEASRKEQEEKEADAKRKIGVMKQALSVHPADWADASHPPIQNLVSDEALAGRRR